MVNIAILGVYGRMGKTLTRLIDERSDCRVCAGIDIAQPEQFIFPVVNEINELANLKVRPDVLIDFSNPSSALAAIEYCGQNALPIVICTTGLPENLPHLINLASKTTAVFYSANMSLGINLLAKLAAKAQATLKGFDVEIVEKHHRNKLDAPSGTALMLADAINAETGGRYEYVFDRSDVRQKRADSELGISSVRGGSIVGEHEIIFAGHDEVVTLSHTAYSREVFAQGAITAALFLVDKPAGIYSMDNVLETAL